MEGGGFAGFEVCGDIEAILAVTLFVLLDEAGVVALSHCCHFVGDDITGSSLDGACLSCRLIEIDASIALLFGKGHLHLDMGAH